MKILIFLACITQAQFAAKEKQFASAEQTRYVAALKKQKLAPITLPMVTWDVDQLGPAPAQREVTRDGKRLLIAGSVGAMCGARPTGAFLLARRGNKIFVVNKEVATQRVDIAVCAPKSCAAAAPTAQTGCGTAPKPTMVAYELPAKVSFGGEITIKIASQWASAEIVGTSSCPPALPPTPRP
jgi:hypothetical protein